MKRITIDARTIESSTGVYTQHLLSELHAIGGYEYTVLVPSQHVSKWQVKLPGFSILPADQKSYSFAEQNTLTWSLKASRPDLVHFTMPQQPFLYTEPAVTTIHDLTLVRYENIDGNPLIYRLKKLVFTSLIKTIVRRANAVIVPTEFVRNDIVDFTNEKYKKKISVTLEAGDLFDIPAEPIDELSGKKFLFWVGNAFPYKNIGRTIEAFAELKKTQPNLHLALAGKKDYFYEQHEKYVNEHGIKDVHFLGFISDGEKRWAFQNADAYVVASLSEGFHIPLLEAMYEDCPVISADASCLPEVAGDAAIYFDPHSTQSLVDAVVKLQNTPGLRTTLINEGKRRARQFSWKRMAQETKAVYDKVLQ